MLSLRKLCRRRPLGAGRPALRSGGQSGEEDRAGPQVTPVVSPLGPLPGQPGVPLHLTPRLPPQVQLQQSLLLGSGHCLYIYECFSLCKLSKVQLVSFVSVSMETGNLKKRARAPKTFFVCEDESLCREQEEHISGVSSFIS